MKIVALNGSPKKDGNTAYLLKLMGDVIKAEGIDFELISVQEALMSVKVPFCINCKAKCDGACFTNTLLEELFIKMKEADGLILGSPVYFGSMSAQMKALFDKSRGLRAEEAFLGKPGVCVASGFSQSGGQETTIKAMQDMMAVHGMTIVNDGYTDFGAGHLGVRSYRDSREDEFAKTRAKSAALRLVHEVRLRTK